MERERHTKGKVPMQQHGFVCFCPNEHCLPFSPFFPSTSKQQTTISTSGSLHLWLSVLFWTWGLLPQLKSLPSRFRPMEQSRHFGQHGHCFTNQAATEPSRQHYYKRPFWSLLRADSTEPCFLRSCTLLLGTGRARSPKQHPEDAESSRASECSWAPPTPSSLPLSFPEWYERNGTLSSNGENFISTQRLGKPCLRVTVSELKF